MVCIPLKLVSARMRQNPHAREVTVC